VIDVVHFHTLTPDALAIAFGLVEGWNETVETVHGRRETIDRVRAMEAADDSTLWGAKLHVRDTMKELTLVLTGSDKHKVKLVLVVHAEPGPWVMGGSRYSDEALLDRCEAIGGGRPTAAVEAKESFSFGGQGVDYDP